MIVPVAEVPETIVGLIGFCNSISSCWYRNSSRSNCRYSYCLRSGSVISTSSGSIGECKGIVYCNSRRLLKLNSNTATSFGSRSRSDRGYSWSRIIIIVPVAEAVPETIVKVWILQ
jgi:hypothetical protein